MEQTIEQYREAYQQAAPDYAYEESIFTEESEKLHAVKEIIAKDLNQVDRSIIIFYADCQSFRTLGKMLGVSHMTARKEVLRIRKHILELYYDRRRGNKGR